MPILKKWKCSDRRWLQVKVKSRGRGRPRHTTQVSVPHRCPSHTSPDPHRPRPTPAQKDTGPSPGIASGPGLRFHQLVSRLVCRAGDVGGARRGGGHWANRGCVCTVQRQTREEGRHFEWHFVTGRGDRYRLRFDHFDFVVPGIELYSSTEGQRGDLVELIPVERGSRGSQLRHAGDGAVFGDVVAEVRLQQSGQLRSPRLQDLDEQAGGVELLGVGRVLQHLDGFFVGGCFLFRNVLEAEVLIGTLIGEEHTVVESVLAAEVVSENDVRQFVREYSGQAGFVRQNVDHAPADHNGVAHAESLEWGSDQHAGANRARQFDIVGDLQIVDDGLQDFVQFAFRRHQSGALQTFENVVFGLLLPFTLRSERRSILRGGRIVFHAVHTNIR